MDSLSAECLEKLGAAWRYRKGYVRENRLEAFRLVNGEADGLKGLNIDYYAGSYLIALREKQYLAMQAPLSEALTRLNGKIQAATPPNFFWFHNIPGQGIGFAGTHSEIKTVKEGDLNFEVRLGESQNTGLFFDQRENRRKIRSLAKKKRILNLFCYTGAFTIAALKGGAKEVHSVDLSKKFLKWLNRNLALNGLSEETSRLYAMDVFQFLKKPDPQLKFDLILCDPPTFSRGKAGSFSTEKNLAELIQSCCELLTPKGKLFISINTKKMTSDQFLYQVRLAIQPHGMKIQETYGLPLDFRLTPEEEKNPYLKACLVG